ncbi:OmpA family protein [Desulfuromusa kysingii]|uniref:OmpA family protein n=1 Tax=Desulfuromusa kysingii TaxID=37625 RepID=A0A1H4CAK7_9BACT|nr:OmpA family protein [Desulfuromusa kysingii]SEA57363.1 OmpA family protein [Desulfuromusa kysingii]
MKNCLYVFVFVLILNMMGCSTSRIVLLDSGKSTNAIIVKTDQGELTLNEPNTFTELASARAIPTKPKTISPEMMEEEYGALINSTPKPPIKFLLYFETDKTILTTQSKQLLTEIKAAVKERIPCEVNVIGHSDRMGSKEYNVDLSLQRARFINAWLVEQKLGIANIIVESYGEEAPLIPTADGIPEPKNRRVEILIR